MSSVLLACGSSGLHLGHLPVLRAYMRRFSGHPGMGLIHGAGDPRKVDEPEALGADRLWEVAAAVEWPWFDVLAVSRYPADWKGQGHRAGPLRNEAMRDALRALAAQGQRVGWVAAHTDPGLGRGTRHMVSLCRAEGWPGRALILAADGRLLEEVR
ncbi:hypothetical protein [Corallococcus sp. AS-1-6]|uniref:hypothetical protein n=1 Tax=Corallococcus sp. AS-1-6 TaxID=2874599 RepID=UPI001CC101AB|nr:hypothetical protein [Corallococcus sp. AS-1-6]MBZ4371456.1 hypothetical protein [Corallococcus sp. AS-1-6]